MSFTFINNGTDPVGIIEGERPRYVYIDENPADDEQPHIFDQKFDPMSIQQLTIALAQGMTLRDVDRTLTEPEASNSYINLEGSPETMTFLPSSNPERVSISGPTGCGKTTIARTYADEYLAIFPDRQVWLFAREDDDPAFSGLTRNQITVDESLPEYEQDVDDILNQRITLDQLSDSLVIFDDMDNLQNKKLLINIHKLMGDIVTNGRKKNIHVIYISHLLMNYQQTRVINNESNKVFFFPGAGTSQIEKFLKSYASMKAGEIDRIIKLKSRWIMLHKSIPRYVMYQKGIFLL